MKKFSLLSLCAIVVLTSCGGGGASKKLLVIGRGEIKDTETEITMSDKSGYAEKSIDITGDKPVTYNVSAPTGKTTVDVPAEAGFYILNLRTDTIVGSQRNLGSDLAGGVMSQEQLKANIDSLIQLTTGANVSAANHNYIVLPNQVVKISSNPDAKVFGPFTNIPGTLDADKDGKAPELYKFYTNAEMRDLIANLKKMTY